MSSPSRMILVLLGGLTLSIVACSEFPSPFRVKDRSPRADQDAPFDPPNTYPGWAYDQPEYVRPAEELTPAPRAKSGDPAHFFLREKVVMIRRPDGYTPEETPRVALWWTDNNGFNWNKAGYFGRGQTDFPLEVEEDGDYGIRFVGPGQELARRATAYPQRVYHVDTTPPQVEVAIEPEQAWYHIDQAITISWGVRDFHLVEYPVRIGMLLDFTAENRELIELQRDLAHEGSITYHLPAEALTHEVTFRVEATDRAGNLGLAYSHALQVFEQLPASQADTAVSQIEAFAEPLSIVQHPSRAPQVGMETDWGHSPAVASSDLEPAAAGGEPQTALAAERSPRARQADTALEKSAADPPIRTSGEWVNLILHQVRTMQLIDLFRATPVIDEAKRMMSELPIAKILAAFRWETGNEGDREGLARVTGDVDEGEPEDEMTQGSRSDDEGPHSLVAFARRAEAAMTGSAARGTESNETASTQSGSEGPRDSQEPSISADAPRTASSRRHMLPFASALARRPQTQTRLRWEGPEPGPFPERASDLKGRSVVEWLRSEVEGAAGTQRVTSAEHLGSDQKRDRMGGESTPRTDKDAVGATMAVHGNNPAETADQTDAWPGALARSGDGWEVPPVIWRNSVPRCYDVTHSNGLLVPLPATVERDQDRPFWETSHPWRILGDVWSSPLQMVWGLPEPRLRLGWKPLFEGRFLADNPILRAVADPIGSATFAGGPATADADLHP